MPTNSEKNTINKLSFLNVLEQFKKDPFKNLKNNKKVSSN